MYGKGVKFTRLSNLKKSFVTFNIYIPGPFNIDFPFISVCDYNTLLFFVSCAKEIKKLATPTGEQNREVMQVEKK